MGGERSKDILLARGVLVREEVIIMRKMFQESENVIMLLTVRETVPFLEV